MAAFHDFEHPPPRSWEQFEELCADLFEAAWNDPALVRHGRGGQRQDGIDIIARQGGRYPIGLQCKKKAHWPIKKLTLREIDKEVEEAKNFKPPLESFYLLTTAVDDTNLQEHVREINTKHQALGIFDVVLLGWSEIVRRVTRYEQVAKKHFMGYGPANLVSPLFATWYVRNGKLELTPREWTLSVAEASEDFFDWPNGHIVTRQRESDELIQKLHNIAAFKETKFRNQRIGFRKELRKLTIKERHVQELISMIFTNEILRFYLDLWEEDGDRPVIIQKIIENEFSFKINNFSDDYKIKLTPPSPHLLSGIRSPYSVAADNIPVSLTSLEYQDIQKIKQSRIKMFNNPLTGTVDELPHSARAGYAIPAILRRIMRIKQEERKSIAEIETAGYFQLSDWKIIYN